MPGFVVGDYIYLLPTTSAQQVAWVEDISGIVEMMVMWVSFEIVMCVLQSVVKFVRYRGQYNMTICCTTIIEMIQSACQCIHAFDCSGI